jgi:glucose-6-phosphate isomerase
MISITASNQVKALHKQKAEHAVTKVLSQSDPLIEALLAQIDGAGESLKSLDSFKNKFSRYALVGIGGSSLGIQVFTQFFAKSNFIFFDNVDAAEFDGQIKAMGSLDDVGWLFISKSGETIETLAVLEYVDQLYSEKNKNLSLQSLIITEKKQSSLSQWAKERNTPQYEIPLKVGGRFSALSYVGLVPAYLMGLDLQAMARGTHQALESKNELVTFTAEALASFDRQEWITMLWSYSSRLKNLGLWWQQLWAESLAKKVDLNKSPAPRVSTPLSLVGATDQHSLLQQIIEGYHDKFVVFLRLQDAEAGSMILKKPKLVVTQALQGLKLGDLLHAEALATQQSLTDAGVSNMSMKIDKLDEENLAYLMMFMQISILVLGSALNLNPLNQPGVEHGKILCKKILAEAQFLNGSK